MSPKTSSVEKVGVRCLRWSHLAAAVFGPAPPAVNTTEHLGLSTLVPVAAAAGVRWAVE